MGAPSANDVLATTSGYWRFGDGAKGVFPNMDMANQVRGALAASGITFTGDQKVLTVDSKHATRLEGLIANLRDTRNPSRRDEPTARG